MKAPGPRSLPAFLRAAARRWRLLAFSLLAVSPSPAADPAAPQDDPGICRPRDKAAVVFFVLSDCPVANALTPEMNRIAADYGERDVRFTFVHVDPDVAGAELERHARDFRLTAPLVADRHHRLVRKAGARVTPQAAIFRPDGSLAWLGRINDLYEGFGVKRQVVTRHDLREALDALLAGQPELPPARGKAVGCYIADFTPEKRKENP